MKKSLIALAVAGAFAAPAFAATSNVDVYGIMSIAIEDTDAANSTPQVTDRVSRIGFKGSEDLGGGLKALWQIESQVSATGNTAGTDGVGGTQSLAGRNTFVGLSGGFGTVLMGRHDTPYKLGTGSLDLFADTIGDYNFGGTLGYMNSVHDMRNASALAYVSPTWSGFHFAVAGVLTNAAANGAKLNDSVDAISMTGIYSNGPIFASLSYQKADEADTIMALTPGTADSSAAWKLGAGYNFGDAKVGFLYEDVNVALTGGGDVDVKTWSLNGAYAMGPITLKAAYYDQTAEVTGAADRDSDKWVVGVDYALSKRTTAYVAYTNDDGRNYTVVAGVLTAGTVDVSGFAVGVKHSF